MIRRIQATLDRLSGFNYELPSDRTYTLDAFFREELRAPPRLAFGPGTSYPDWRAAVDEALRGLLGAPRRRAPLRPQIVESVRRSGYVRDLVVYDTEAGATVTAYVLRPPRQGRHPAIVCLHGHGPIGKRNVAGAVGLDPRKLRHVIRSRYNCAETLARHGYVCLCPDARGWGDRSDGFFRISREDLRDPYGGQRDPCNMHFLKAQALGLNLLWLNLWDDMRGVDYLVSRDDVAPDRVGSIGLSLGGTRALWLAAFDERVRATVAACALTTLREQVYETHYSCGSQLLPGMLRVCDLGDLAGLAAPRALRCESGRSDPIFSLRSAEEAFRTTRAIYEAAGARDACEHAIFEGGHRFEGDGSISFFDRVLQ